MAKLSVLLHVIKPGRGKKYLKVHPLIDSGSDMTLFPSSVARELSIRPVAKSKVERVKMMGVTIPFWFVHLNLYIPDTDCLVENHRVGFAFGEEEDDDLPYAILGTDFLQRTGGLLDFGQGRHAIACDPEARGAHLDAPLMARRKRLRSRESR